MQPPTASPIWGITTYFNPARYETRRVNYQAFRARSRAHGLPLLTVEWTTPGREHELHGRDADILIQRTSDTVLWHKEALLNVALANLPDTCRAVVWIDADVLFEDRTWVRDTLQALETSPVVQPFSRVIRLPRGASPDEYPSERIGWRIRQGHRNGFWTPSFALGLNAAKRRLDGTTGYVWAARRELLDRHHFYDRCIVGGADRAMALAFALPSDAVPAAEQRVQHAPLQQHLRAWHDRVHADVRGQIGVLPGVIHHLWHGESQHRGYVDRHQLLVDHAFDPEHDVALSPDGVLHWSSPKPGLADAVRDYFASRREDG